ncbi:MAG: hypothetical protein QCH31_03275 [Methanolobus sp.]|nr:hypothetical protein [Methanolobus sp.]
MTEKKPEGIKQRHEESEGEKEVKVTPIHPGDSRVRPKRHLLDTCE